MAVFVISAQRTPFGAFGGKLKDFSSVDLAVHACTKTFEAARVHIPVSSVIIGNVLQTGMDAPYLARHAALRMGLPIEIPALTVNRLCGSGFQSLISGVHEILLGESQVVLTGGTESMSQAPLVLSGTTRFGIKYGQSPVLQDSLSCSLVDQYISTPMGVTAEHLAKKHRISRLECDEFALRSQELYHKAKTAGIFTSQISPIEIKVKKLSETMSEDEHPRQTNLEKLAKLQPSFIENGTVTAGNASGICDGAAAVLIAGEKAVKNYGLKPMARIVSWGIVGVDPAEMGIGPVNAIKLALLRADMKLEDMDLIEVNEAFAAQYLAVEKELNLDREKTNLQGGAIAIGHPLGASGSRITGHLAHQLQATGKKYGLGAACIGGGQGIAVILESVSK